MRAPLPAPNHPLLFRNRSWASHAPENVKKWKAIAESKRVARLGAAAALGAVDDELGAVGIIVQRSVFSSLSFQEAQAAKAEQKQKDADDLLARKAAREQKALESEAERASRSAAFQVTKAARAAAKAAKAAAKGLKAAKAAAPRAPLVAPKAAKGAKVRVGDDDAYAKAYRPRQK